jgi:DNA-binding SARP family transcriptional activator
VVPARSALLDEVHPYAIQLAKVQRPALREETLERPRLLDWLRAKIHGRVTLLLADAGYGKTTLLADFARRTRLRTMWYRLDEDDRDWVTFLRHLVAAGREFEPTFAPRTTTLLSETGIGGPSRETVLEAFMAELPTIAAGGALLIFDDFHLVDDAVDVRHITRELLAHGPERLTFAIASRRTPTVPLARLRAIGDVAELGTEELRFDRTETAKLFTETYGRRLEPDVLTELADRTEGWIASLQMVQAALRDRSPTEIRRFIRNMTGADHELSDYLAEEVVGDLEPDLQRFLMETSILMVVTAELARVATGASEPDVAKRMGQAERLTLLSRASGGPRTRLRYHPLVRGFLESRLLATDGSVAVAALHRRVADATAETDWRTSAHHYREAGDFDAVQSVLSRAIPAILGNGQYAVAEGFIRRIPAERRPASFDLILSRVDMQHGDIEAAIATSEAVLASDRTNRDQRDHALLNLATMNLNVGDAAKSLRFMAQLRDETASAYMRALASAGRLLIDASNDGDLDVIARELRNLAETQANTNVHHYGVTMFAMSLVASAQDDDEAASDFAQQSIEALSTTGGRLELLSVRTALAGTQIRRGVVSRADQLLEYASAGTEFELRYEYGGLLDTYGDDRLAAVQFAAAQSLMPAGAVQRRLRAQVLAARAIRNGDYPSAEQHLAELEPALWTDVGFESVRLTTVAHLAIARGADDAKLHVQRAIDHAQRQKAHAWRRRSELLRGTLEGAANLGVAIRAVGANRPWHVTYVADVVVRRLQELDNEALAVVDAAARAHPARWRTVLRRDLEAKDAPLICAQLLEEIGERQDIPILRRLARRGHKRSPSQQDLGRALSRRLAARVVVEDQGRVWLRIGDRHVPGSDIRRKVLALLCYLLTRTSLSGTRDQVVEAIWPDLDPQVAINSLNQTLYFLRRVFEDPYDEDLSPGYVHHDSEVIWLDPELVTSRTVQARDFIRQLELPASPEDVSRLANLYRGRFAIDFEYEEWSESYRDLLHAAYLEVVERSIADDFQTGHYDRAIRIARQAMEVDPHADNIEVGLLRLYRVTGAHAAAAEQYEHYASVQRDDLGVEPPPLDAL